VTLTIATGPNTGGDEGDATAWEIREKQAEDVIVSGGPLESNQAYEVSGCLSEGTYIFNVADSGGNGFNCNIDNGEICSYNVFVEGVLAGTGSDFWDNEVMTFPVPLHALDSAEDDAEPCGGDFYFAVFADDYPSEITWVVTDVEGASVLSGGPYEKIGGGYSEYACLDDGNYTFTITHSGDALSSFTPGGYVVVVNIDEIIVYSPGLTIGASVSTSFVIGGSGLLSQQETTNPPSAAPPELALGETTSISLKLALDDAGEIASISMPRRKRLRTHQLPP